LPKGGTTTAINWVVRSLRNRFARDRTAQRIYSQASVFQGGLGTESLFLRLGGKTWHAYLSTQGQAGVNAKDRIGNGPWFNAKGVQIASNIADLHNNNKINKETGLDERGMAVKGRGDTPNQHDMLTGTQQDGTAVPGSDDATCSNWTSSTDGGQGSAVVGHHDLVGNSQGPNFWNYSHKTPGCSQANLQRVGGGGNRGGPSDLHKHTNGRSVLRQLTPLQML
jgi:hypothetical protein